MYVYTSILLIFDNSSKKFSSTPCKTFIKNILCFCVASLFSSKTINLTIKQTWHKLCSCVYVCANLHTSTYIYEHFADCHLR